MSIRKNDIQITAQDIFNTNNTIYNVLRLLLSQHSISILDIV